MSYIRGSALHMSRGQSVYEVFPGQRHYGKRTDWLAHYAGLFYQFWKYTQQQGEISCLVACRVALITYFISPNKCGARFIMKKEAYQ